MRSGICIIINIICLSSFTFAQETKPEFSHFSIRANCGIPKVLSSQAFRYSFSGIVAADGGINYSSKSGVFIGIGYSYTLLKSQKYFRDKYIYTGMQMHNGYAKIGLDHFFSQSGFTTISLSAGYNFNQYQDIVYASDSVKNKFPTNFNSTFVEPQVGIYYLIESNFAIGGYLSYNYNFKQFNPGYPGFDKWYNYGSVSNTWNISYLSIGFGFYYGVTRNK